jgi:hypothetical protein
VSALPLPEDHGARLTTARARAGWELGDPAWADVIIAAYLHPEEDAAALAEVRDAPITPDPWQREGPVPPPPF